MAARTLKPRHQDEIRAKIQGSAIIHRLMECHKGNLVLTDQQVSCGKILLNKVLPDLKAVEMTGDLDLTHKVRGWKKL
jgi:hypothetical protein